MGRGPRKGSYEICSTKLPTYFPGPPCSVLDQPVASKTDELATTAPVLVGESVLRTMTGAQTIGSPMFSLSMLSSTKDGLLDGWLPIKHVVSALITYRIAKTRTFEATESTPRHEISVEKRIASSEEVQWYVTASAEDRKRVELGAAASLAHWNRFLFTVSIFDRDNF